MILGTSLGVILFVGSLMVTLFNLDLESLFKGEEQAMKVGSIVVSFSDFSLLKRLSGREGTNFSNSDFASELLETMLWAEAGRKIGIDRQNLYLQKLQEFDSAVSEASDSAILSRALFLLEELARLTREFVQSKIPPPTDSEVEDYLRKNPEMISPEQIHVRTILVQNQSHAEQIFQEASAGNSFFS
ncbi:hypothetical protein HYY75_06820, partial [bacterium]|nr:hypothetical protein [bacterium]